MPPGYVVEVWVEVVIKRLFPDMACAAAAYAERAALGVRPATDGGLEIASTGHIRKREPADQAGQGWDGEDRAP